MELSQKSHLPVPVDREVSLLSRHWAWLAEQPRGASSTLCRLIDEARRDRHGRFAIDAARERCYVLMRDLAGDGPGFEEACRALYAGDAARFATILAGWPEGVRQRVETVAGDAWPAQGNRSEQG